MNTISENIKRLQMELEKGNGRGEKVSIIAATKMQPPEAINEAILAGVDGIAENKPQEFRDKNDLLLPCPRHFIGHLQTNKIKYLIGKIQLYHSCDRMELIEMLAKQSLAKGVVSDILLQINIGEEASKGGFSYEEAKVVFAEVEKMEGLRVRGFMAMLPNVEEESYLRSLAQKMRQLFDWAKGERENIDYLSMGMSGDYALCLEEGSNMIRVGSTIFGRRNYDQ
ncbi:MAG: YggS family pyridoxal phosphate-dependent enzyme [Clostridia bacterium]|nr:YggS family pyridoxal phosphate-dependent enzyme [Clostridia bacterium]